MHLAARGAVLGSREGELCREKCFLLVRLPCPDLADWSREPGCSMTLSHADKLCKEVGWGEIFLGTDFAQPQDSHKSAWENNE